MSDSDNFGSDLESDSLGSHLGASDEEVDDECNVNAVRMQPTRDLGGPEDWGRLNPGRSPAAYSQLVPILRISNFQGVLEQSETGFGEHSTS